MMIVFALFLRLVIGAKETRIRNIPFVVIAASLVFLELIKQYRDFVPGPYGLYSIPLHFSSVFLLLFPLAHFTSGAFSRTMRPIAGIASGMTTIGMLFFPMTVFGDAANGYFTDFGSFHTVTYHYAIVLYFILFVALEMHEPETKKDALRLFTMITIYAAIAGPLANIIEVNFMSFLFCSFPPIEAVRLALGEAIGPFFAQSLYVLFMYLAILSSCTLATLLYRALDVIVRRLPKGIRIAKRIRETTE
ncbi:MAG: hypothetical protein A2Y16_03360 [Tenericutes bacterium GWF2_57_13]|nr:MAG: hypothetical protein A2Y16_03360 [Tenericutes bacterium GWF2_57_13]